MADFNSDFWHWYIAILTMHQHTGLCMAAALDDHGTQ